MAFVLARRTLPIIRSVAARALPGHPFRSPAAPRVPSVARPTISLTSRGFTDQLSTISLNRSQNATDPLSGSASARRFTQTCSRRHVHVTPRHTGPDPRAGSQRFVSGPSGSSSPQGRLAPGTSAGPGNARPGERPDPGERQPPGPSGPQEPSGPGASGPPGTVPTKRPPRLHDHGDLSSRPRRPSASRRPDRAGARQLSAERQLSATPTGNSPSHDNSPPRRPATLRRTTTLRHATSPQGRPTGGPRRQADDPARQTKSYV